MNLNPKRLNFASAFTRFQLVLSLVEDLIHHILTLS